jgi:hypothetical protein
MNAIQRMKLFVPGESAPTTHRLRPRRQLETQLDAAKFAILSEFRETLRGNEKLLRLALTEAEALAWQTDFPQLVFPTLAAENAERVAAWHARQQSMQRGSPQLAFAE